MKDQNQKTEQSPARALTTTEENSSGSNIRSGTSSGSSTAGNNPTAVELPKGGGAIRSMGEKFSANPVTGTASFSIPLPVSKGRNKFQPQLSLSYNSGGGNSPFGMGWNVGIASITRKTNKGLPKYTPEDVFLLAGAEDLVLVLESNGTTYKREETNYLVYRYRPRVEGLYHRIERWEDKNSGVSHWRLTDKENVTSVFGESLQARVFDPNHEKNIFEWMIEKRYDALGNIIQFEYKRENDQNIDPSHPWEGNRLSMQNSFNRLYPKKILYGNTVMFTDPSFESTNDWHFQLVMDYGEHPLENPTPSETNPWPVRQDPFSTYQARFELRTYRLCRRVLLFHQFSGENQGNPFLVKALELSYDENPIASQLNQALQRGYRDGNSETIPALKFSYTQAEVNPMVQKLDPEITKNLPAGIGSGYRWADLYGEGISGILNESGGAWFYQPNDGDKNYYKDHPEEEEPKPVLDLAPMLRLKHHPVPGTPADLQDMDGDGKPELVIRQPGMQGIFEWPFGAPEGLGEVAQRREPQISKGYFQPFDGAPNLDWESEDIRFVDLTGDGLADILITQEDQIAWIPYHNDPPGYDKPHQVANALEEEKGPRVVFSNGYQNIFLADMSGDGLSDLLRIENGSVCYWPNLGYGHFGAKVSMGSVPHFERRGFFDGSRIRLGDTDGSGTTDIIYLGIEKTTYYLNQSGNSLADPVELELFPQMDNLESIGLQDIFGNGTACLVWSSPQEYAKPFQIRYIDLMGQKPYLLEETDNSMGGLRKFSYAPSTKFYLRDQREGTPWATKLPFPVQTLERVEVYEQITDRRFVSRYAYHHGYFDPVEREFRGFGMVEQWDSETYASFNLPALYQVGSNALEEESHTPPTYSKSWFHNGYYNATGRLEEAYQKEYWQGDVEAWHLPSVVFSPQQYANWMPEELREAHRALKGSLLRQEVYGLDGTEKQNIPYQVTENSFFTQLLQKKGRNRHAVFRVFQREALSYGYERETTDPRISHQLTLETDTYGNVLQAAQVGYPRRGTGHEPEQQRSYISVNQTSFINKEDSLDFYRIGAPEGQSLWEFRSSYTPDSENGLPPWRPNDLKSMIHGATLIPPEGNFTGSGNEKQLQSQAYSTYYSQDLASELPLGEIAAHGLPYRSYQLAFTEGLIEAIYNTGTTRIDLNTSPNPMTESGYIEDPFGSTQGRWWVPSGRMVFNANAFYQLQEQHDPFGGVTQLTYDAYDLLITQVEDPLGNNTSVDNEYVNLQAWQLTNANGNRQAVTLDALGRVTAQAVMGKAPSDPDYPGYEEGDSLAVPGTTFTYNFHAFQQSGDPASVTVVKRETHIHAPNANNDTLTEVAYTDGLGKELQRRVQFGEEENGIIPVSVTGRQIKNNKDLVVVQYEPYLDSGLAYTENTPPEASKIRMYYDALNRLVRTDFEDGTFTKVEFNAWQQREYDQNDTVIDSQWYIDRGSPDPSGSEPNDPEERAAWLAAKAYNTPRVLELDPLGRMFLRRNDNGSDGTPVFYDTRFELSIKGNKRKMIDARGMTTEYKTGLHDPKVGEEGEEEQLWSLIDNPDSGKTWLLPDVMNKPSYSWDGRGYRQRMEYDIAQRPIEKWVQAPNNTNESLKQRTVYGETANSPRTENLLGQIFEQYDQAGKQSFTAYDFKGNLNTEERKFAQVFDTVLDYSGSVTFLTEIYSTSYTYDALDRPTSKTTPDSSTANYNYAKNAMLESQTLEVRGSGNEEQAINDITYNAKGQRTDIYYANGSKTKYVYDLKTFRINRILTTRNNGQEILQDINYTFDAAGNITQQRDDAQQTIYFSNQVVQPLCKYTYDALYRLKQATGRELNGLVQPSASDCPIQTPVPDTETHACRNYTLNYDYDELGNILQIQHIAQNGNWTRNYFYPTDNNKLIGHTSGQTDYTYDEAGNMLSMPHLSEMGWDEDDMLVKADLGGGGTAYYRYDGRGQRIRKVIVNGNVKKERLYINDFELWQQSTNGTIEIERETLSMSDKEKSFLRLETLTIDNSNIISTPFTKWRYQCDNPLQSICLELDKSASIISYEEYYPFGTTSYRSGKNQAEVKLKQYRYNGKERDEETGLYYYGARYLAAWIGRFISSDPIGDDFPGLSNYQYASNNPILNIDLDGLEGMTGFFFGNQATAQQQAYEAQQKWGNKPLSNEVKSWPWDGGVSSWYFDLDVGAGIGYGLNYVEQSGIAYDEVGKTHFIMSSILKITNQNLEDSSRNPQLIGGIAASLTFNYKLNKSANTFYGLVGGASLSLPTSKPGYGVSFALGWNKDEFNIGVGLGAGFKINILNPEIKESISLTDKQAEIVNDATDVWTESWIVKHEIFDKDSKTWSGAVYTKDKRGEFIYTGVTVNSSNIQDENGNNLPLGVWTSKEYRNQAIIAENK